MFGVYDCTGHGVPGAFMTYLLNGHLMLESRQVDIREKTLTVQVRSSRMLMISSERW